MSLCVCVCVFSTIIGNLPFLFGVPIVLIKGIRRLPASILATFFVFEISALLFVLLYTAMFIIFSFLIDGGLYRTPVSIKVGASTTILRFMEEFLVYCAMAFLVFRWRSLKEINDVSMAKFVRRSSLLLFHFVLLVLL